MNKFRNLIEALDAAPASLAQAKVTRESDHKQVERTRVIGRVQDFPAETQAFGEAERLRLYTIEPGSKRGKLTFAILGRMLFARIEEGVGIREAQTEGRIHNRGQGFIDPFSAFSRMLCALYGLDGWTKFPKHFLREPTPIF